MSAATGAEAVSAAGARASAVRLARGLALGLLWATYLSADAALGGRDGKAGAIRIAKSRGWAQ